MNKHGEIVFDDNGKVLEVNGYDGDRKSFEYIELSTYYSRVEAVEYQIHLLEIYLKDLKSLVKDLT